VRGVNNGQPELTGDKRGGGKVEMSFGEPLIREREREGEDDREKVSINSLY
jgi:hypothetical protein